MKILHLHKISKNQIKMKIALIGYGKMGKEIEKIALERNHIILMKIDGDKFDDFSDPKMQDVDVAIEFTQPESAFNNYIKCFEANIPVVSGTTGWLEKLPEIKNICKNKHQTFFYSSNFSLGVNLFFKLNEYLAKLMNKYSEYNVSITETHHTEKKDAPSGTAITLAEDLINIYQGKTKWVKETEIDCSELAIKSLRKVNVPGTHTISYESNVDTIEIIHTAKNRQGLALGTVLAAEFVFGKKGFFGMNDLLNL